MDSVSPVLTEDEVAAEQVVALGSEEFFPIIVCRVAYNDKDGNPAGVGTLIRFRFNERERALIAQGADLILSQPHHSILMPIALQIAMPGTYPLPEK